MRIDSDKSQSITASKLRRHAEEQLGTNPDASHAPHTEEGTQRIVHELEVHQIELEMQNVELRRTQEEFELSRDKYAELYELAPVGYFTFDTQGLIREVNLTGAKMLGVERRALADKPFSRFIADADGRNVFSTYIETVLLKEDAQRCEIRLTGKDGTAIHGRLQSVSVDTIESKDSYILCSIVDGTLGKQLETEIQDAREFAENIVETVREPLVVLDSDLRILTANPSFYETFKVTTGETVGNFIYDLGNRQWDLPKLRVLFEEILPHDTVFNGYEVEHDFLEIGPKIMLLNARRIFRKKTGSPIILLAMEDITERRRAEDALAEKRCELEEFNRSLETRIVNAVDELREKDQMLILNDRLAIMGEMIDNIAQQWRQPLDKLGLVVQQIPLYYDSGEFREFLKENTAKAMELIQHMSQTINDFRGFFRSDKVLASFGINQVITRTLSLIEKSFEGQEIDIVFHPEGDPKANGFPNEFSQVLLNILMNARDMLVAHHTDDARISIRAFAEEGRSVVTITDNAGGISDELIDRIFDPYVTSKGPDSGTGIGLFMSKSIIEKNMGGKLAVRNTGDGVQLRIEV